MQEIEARFLNISSKDIRTKLKEIGAKRIHKPILFERYTFDLINPNIKGYGRIRSEGNNVTATVKIYDNTSKYPIEHELNLNNTLEEAKIFIISLGFTIKSYQQTIREKWSINNCKELVIDTIPGLPTYIEIECDTEKDIKYIAKKLELNYDDATYGPYGKLFDKYYKIPEKEFNEKISSLTFNNIDKELYMVKNKSSLLKLKKQQLKLYEKAKNNLKKYIKKK